MIGDRRFRVWFKPPAIRSENFWRSSHSCRFGSSGLLRTNCLAAQNSPAFGKRFGAPQDRPATRPEQGLGL